MCQLDGMEASNGMVLVGQVLPSKQSKQDGDGLDGWSGAAGGWRIGGGGGPEQAGFTRTLPSLEIGKAGSHGLSSDDLGPQKQPRTTQDTNTKSMYPPKYTSKLKLRTLFERPSL